MQSNIGHYLCWKEDVLPAKVEAEFGIKQRLFRADNFLFSFLPLEKAWRVREYVRWFWWKLNKRSAIDSEYFRA